MTGPVPAPDTPQPNPSAVTAVTPQQAAAQAQQQSQLRSLAEVLVTDPGVSAQVMKGKLLAVNYNSYPPLCTIQLGGDTSSSIADVRFLDSYVPVVNDTILIVKQGSELFVLGQMAENAPAGQESLSGWQTPVLSTTWNSNPSAIPVRYRKVLDNGSYKIQLQGRVNRNGTNTGTVLWTMPAGYIPGVVRNMVATRENLNGGSNAVQLSALPNGNIEISGHLLDTSAAQHGNLTTSYYDVNHVHILFDDGQGPDNVNNDPANEGTSAVKYTFGGGNYNDGVLGGSAQDGGNSPNHRHTTNSATHVHSTSFPSWVALDGIEYWL